MRVFVAICVILCSCAHIEMTYEECFADAECTAAFEEAHEPLDRDEGGLSWTD